MSDASSPPAADASATTASSSAAKRTAPAVIAAAALLDIVGVLVFAAIGRSHHGHIGVIVGVWHTAWPFLAALTLVWLAALIWRAPTKLLRAGVPVWLGTALAGVAIRSLFAGGSAPIEFVLVGTGSIGLTLLGWRLVWALVARLRQR